MVAQLLRQAEGNFAVEAWADRGAEPQDVAAMVAEVLWGLPLQYSDQPQPQGTYHASLLCNCVRAAQLDAACSSQVLPEAAIATEEVEPEEEEPPAPLEPVRGPQPVSPQTICCFEGAFVTHTP